MKTFFAVSQFYYDNGRVNCYILEEQHESKPEQFYQRMRRCDAWTDYFETYEGAATFAAVCSKA